MNELNKLLSSLLLLGAGFVAASLIGPPESIDRLAHYLRPSGPAPTDGLRPLDPATVAGGEQREWPALPVPAPAQAETLAPPAAPTPSAEAFAFSAPATPASWPADPAPTNSAPSEDWLTSESFAPPQPAEPTGDRLTPIPRADQTVSRNAVADPAEMTGDPAWPALAPPAPPSAPRQEPADLSGPARITARKPSLEDSPYSTRQQPAAADDWGSLGFAPVAPRLERIERAAPPAPSYGDHIVTDGDTLPLLAERYLGDAARAGELYELNRDRLEHPDVLPIGMVLKTPQRGAAPRAFVAETAPAPHGAFATLTAADASRTFSSRPALPRVESQLTPVVPDFGADADPIRPAAPARDPLFASEAQWSTGGW